MSRRLCLAAAFGANALLLAGFIGIIAVTLPPGPPPEPAAPPPISRAVEMVELSSGTPTCDGPFTVDAVRTLLQSATGDPTVRLKGAAPDPVQTTASIQVCRVTVLTERGARDAQYTLQRSPVRPGWRLSVRLT